MAGITIEVVDRAEAWLVKHGHGLDGIAHPEGQTVRFLAATALQLNVFPTSDPETSRLVVECIALRHSGGKVGDLS